MTPTPAYHIPVLLHETIQGLAIQPGGVYVDLTFGGGGHSRAILAQLGAQGRLYGFDQDFDAMQGALPDKRFTFVRSNFRFVKNWMTYHGHEQVDGILADLGVSSHHLDTQERGFSFRFDAPLDMRMNQRAHLTAFKIVNEYAPEDLARVLYLYGELHHSRRLAQAIVQARSQAPIATTGALADILASQLQSNREKKDMARVFQALRIEVNGEMAALSQMLRASAQMLRPGGRMAVLTYHSLEDRMVKNFFRAGNVEGHEEKDFYGRPLAPLRPVQRGVIVPSAQELNANPRSRSAKLRIAEKADDRTTE